VTTLPLSDPQFFQVSLFFHSLAALQPACHPQESALHENHTFCIPIKTKTEEAQKTSVDPHFGQNLVSFKCTSLIGSSHLTFSQHFLLWRLWSLNTFSISHCQGKHLDELCTHRYFPLRSNYAPKQLISHLGHN
jgi:hypothetical protein